jgi:two-component system alkaline phosphatase synthesis response regulator PhoP
VPILFLTARSTDADRLLGLKVGADDYLAKPFLLEELILRIHGIFRRQEWYRSSPDEREVYRFGANEVNFLTFEATSQGRTVSLTEKECMLMKLLVERRNQVVSREEILERVWGYRFSTSSRTIDNFIVRLRRYFEDDPKSPRYIQSVRGVGYRLTVPG